MRLLLKEIEMAESRVTASTCSEVRERSGDITTELLERMLSKITEIATTQSDLASQLSEVASAQSDLTQSHHDVVERMNEMEGLVHDRVDPTRSNPDFSSHEEEVVTATGTALPLRHLSSFTTVPHSLARPTRSEFESFTEDPRQGASTGAYQLRRSERIRERQAHHFHPQSQGPHVAAGASSPSSLVARGGEALVPLYEGRSDGHSHQERLRRNHTCTSKAR